MGIADDSLWYKDAIIYQLHVRAFSDSNADGVGDFAGLTGKLDYLQDLGVNTLWLLPFYPSPLRDDGYDISDYRCVHPQYGTLADFRLFLREAHRRGLRVITELVINHTSDQHPWFQGARRAPPNSLKRDYYVWSDTVKKYQGTRIIFSDSEKSNWAWDETAQAYYWHRFFSHQPDLNFDNPHVVKAVLRAMRFWFDMGVDGMRLDAIPYLCEREGTSNENLPETHAVIRRLRADLDRHYSNRVFLAEANQWPEDVREYFGDGDECHMAFNFPLMPRIFMAVAQEDHHPIVDILAQIPEIPPNCQWAVFLRNHDELTLEMVTDRERDYMYHTYAVDPRARLNLGIRRRLAPLMEGNRAKIELTTSLILSMPGSPIVYYGDEIGMGDNIYLGDRNGVRTPMQWSPDRNAGFSHADPQRLYLPPIMDPVYGFESVNVEAQSRNPSSLLHWMRRLIATRKAHQAFGRGGIEFLRLGNRKIIAYVREYGEELILCVANLSHSAQPAELDLAEFKGKVPVELLGRTAFPAIGELPYFLSLPPYGFYWFRLAADVAAPVWHVDKLPREELPVLVLPEGLLSMLRPKTARTVHGVLAGKTRKQLESEVLPVFLAGQRWFFGADQKIAHLELVLDGEWESAEGRRWLPLLVKLAFESGAAHSYFLPLGLLLDEAAEQQYHALSPWMLAKARQRARVGMLYDALGEDAFCLFLLHAMEKRLSFPFGDGHLAFARTAAFPELPAAPAVARPGMEQSNTSIVFGELLFLKVYRRVQEGINPELEMGRFLTEVAPCGSVVPLAGSLAYREGGAYTAIAALHRYVPNQGTGWDYTLAYLDRHFSLFVDEPEHAGEAEAHAVYLAQMTTLGQCTAQMHRALSTATGDPAFDPEPLDAAEVAAEAERSLARAVAIFDQLELALRHLPEASQRASEKLLGMRLRVLDRVAAALPNEGPLHKTRIHGNYHLGQILVARNDFFIIDFEGDPARPLGERRAKQSPLKDVADLRYSLAAAAGRALGLHLAERPDLGKLLKSAARAWERAAFDAFTAGYRTAIAGCPACADDPEQERGLLALFVLEKALEQLGAALALEPDRLEPAVRILSELVEPEETATRGPRF